jgi:hypothetical protein
MINELACDTVQLATLTASSRSIIYHFKNIYIDCVGTYIDFVESIYLLRKKQYSSSREHINEHISRLYDCLLNQIRNASGATEHC